MCVCAYTILFSIFSPCKKTCWFLRVKKKKRSLSLKTQSLIFSFFIPTNSLTYIDALNCLSIPLRPVSRPASCQHIPHNCKQNSIQTPEILSKQFQSTRPKVPSHPALLCPQGWAAVSTQSPTPLPFPPF